MSVDAEPFFVLTDFNIRNPQYLGLDLSGSIVAWFPLVPQKSGAEMLRWLFHVLGLQLLCR